MGSVQGGSGFAIVCTGQAHVVEDVGCGRSSRGGCGRGEGGLVVVSSIAKAETRSSLHHDLHYQRV
jgi:hypothetical protein